MIPVVTRDSFADLELNAKICATDPRQFIHYRQGRHCPREARIIGQGITDHRDVPDAAAQLGLTREQVWRAWGAFRQYQDRGVYDREGSI